MKSLYAILLLVGTCCAQSTGSGSSVISGNFIDGSSIGQAEDVPLPNFTVVDGSPLQLPIGVNPLAYLAVGAPTHTVYIGDTARGCPKAPGANGSTSQTYCTYMSNNPGGGVPDDFTALNAVTAAWDGTYWDVWVTHGSHFDSPTPWIWPYVAATGWIVFHSDCTQASPCPGTNDLGYNPRGRQVCSHGGMDQLTNPPLPNMGWRNHGCTGSVLGFPPTSAPVPVTSWVYPCNSSNMGTGNCPSAGAYDDLANMWTVSSSSGGAASAGLCAGYPSTYCSTTNLPTLGSIIQMTWGSHDSSTQCYGGYCPTDGINHIGIQDAAIVADPTGHSIFPVKISSLEWDMNPNPNPLVNQFAAAAPHDIFFDEDYFTSDADDDGFGVNFIASEIAVGCVRCAFDHNYFDGVKRDGGEGHVLSTQPPGPYQIIDNWVEGNSVGLWGGGGSTPPYYDASGNPATTQNTERARNRITYNPRWHPSPAGIQADTPQVASWTCASGALVMTMKSTVSLGETTGGIYTPIIYVNLPGSGITAQWYSAAAFTPCTSNCTATVPSITSCTGSTTVTGNIAGFEYATQNGAPITVTSAAALNADSCGSSTYGSLERPCDATKHMNPSHKNPTEWKESQAVWTDAELLENSAVDGQSGELWTGTVRSCSGISKCSGGQTQDINDIAITNSIFRHGNEGLEMASRSANGSLSCNGDAASAVCSAYTANNTLASVTCDATYSNVIDFTFGGAGPNILNAPGAVSAGSFNPSAQTYTGTDAYVYNVGSDLASLLPSGWYQTENISYTTVIPVYLPAGETCTSGHAYSTQGTLFVNDNSNGNGISYGMHHIVNQNNLIYDIGNHLNWNGKGTDIPSFITQSGGNVFGGQVTMGGTSGTYPSGVTTACGVLTTQVACAVITAINACPAAIWPVSSRPIPDCPLVLQAEVGDLMNAQCPANVQFSVGPNVSAANGGGGPSTKGQPILALDPNQQWFTYVPAPVSGSLPSPGTTASCPLEPPNGSWPPLSTDLGSSGFYNHQNYPKSAQFNHNTAVAMNGGRVYGGSDEVNLTWKNNILATPGAGDTGLPGIGTQVCGNGVSCGFTFGQNDVDTYSGPTAGMCTGAGTNVSGITNMGDPATLTFSNNGIAGVSLGNYPIWQSAAPTCTESVYAANGNTAPTQTSTPGATVTCSGSPCSTSNYSPDSIGFVGATNTNTYPLSLSDWRYYAVSCNYWTSQGLTCPTTGGIDPNSPYKTGNLFQASDGLDNGVIPAYIANAFARTLRPCLLASGCPTYYHDGPQYEWLTWKCTGTCSSFNVYEDGSLVLTTTNLYAQVYGLAVNSSHTWTVTSASGSVSGLTSQMY